MEIAGKKYKLVRAFMIPEHEVETRWATDYDTEDTHEVDLARKDMEVKECYVLVEDFKASNSQDEE